MTAAGLTPSDETVMSLANKICHILWGDEIMDVSQLNQGSSAKRVKTITPQVQNNSEQTNSVESVNNALACSCKHPFNLKPAWYNHLKNNPDHRMRCVCDTLYQDYAQFRDHVLYCDLLRQHLEEQRSI